MNTFFIHCSEAFRKCFGFFRIIAGGFVAGDGVFGGVFRKLRSRGRAFPRLLFFIIEGC
jgi:hypothetical protein